MLSILYHKYIAFLLRGKEQSVFNDKEDRQCSLRYQKSINKSIDLVRQI